jgi:alkanesulfonate monooxygenase SsuD/methylene tetrahydromethanopterin reductase-like flavin-dependent oxidoreductase (luciferase family)
VLPFRHPLITAKLIASIDALSNGRVILGVGTGWMPEEFAAVGADFHSRGRDTDACLQFLRRVFADGELDNATVLPRPVQVPGPPIWVGGQTPAALRRTVEFGDVWDAPYADPDGVAAGLQRLRQHCEANGRDPGSIGVSVRGIAADQVDDHLVSRYAALGVTHIGVILPVADEGAALDALAALAGRCSETIDPR